MFLPVLSILALESAHSIKYRMWKKEESKLELAASMVRQVMPGFSSQKNVIILCDSWYTKQNLVSIVKEYPNLDLIGNARADSVIYDLAPAPTGRKDRPAKHGKCLSADADFTLSDEKINGYYIGVRRVLTNLFGSREVLAYVTTPEKDSCTRRLFFGTIFPEQLQIFCTWQEKASLNQTGSKWFQFRLSSIFSHQDTTVPCSVLPQQPQQHYSDLK